MLSQSIHSLARTPVDAAGQIPPPRRRWLTRIGIPAAIVLTTAALLAFVLRDQLLPATPVHIVRTIAKPTTAIDSPTTNESPVSHESTDSAAIIAQAPGWVEPDPFPIRIPALTEGTIQQVLVLEGDVITAGQVVARMIDDEANLAVRKAEAEVLRRQAALDAAQAQWDNPVARARLVAVSEAMVQETEAEIAQVIALTDVEKAKLAELESVSKRFDGLTEGIIETEKVERARFHVTAQRASVQALIKQRQLIEAKARRYAAELKAARQDYELRIQEKQALADAKAMQQEAIVMLDEAKLRQARMEIKAAVPGIVMVRHVAPGSRMMMSASEANASQVVDLYDPAKLQVRADVPLGDAANIGVGQRAQIIVDVLPERVFTGRVTRLVHQADIGKNTIQVKVAIDDPVAQLKPEMLARVKFLVKSSTGHAADSSAPRAGASALRVFVPENVVIKDANGPAVWTVDAKSNTARRKVITLGSIRQDGWIETIAGLNPGDAVIATPQDLEEGQRVRVVGDIENASKR